MTADKVCPLCGTRLDELKSGVDMGCGECYRMLAPDRKKGEKRPVYRGLRPEDLGRYRQDKPDNEPAECDVVVTSRVILARNLAGCPFPARMNARMAGEMTDKIRCVLGENYRFTPLGGNKTFVRRADEEETAILLGEEDHIRMQCVLPGLALYAGYGRVRQIERRLNACLPFAFDERWGYLTRSRENAGTALRGSVSLLLPGLNRLGETEFWKKLGEEQGMLLLDGGAVNAFALVNRSCAGQSEEEMLDMAERFARRLTAAERMARQRIGSGEREDIWWENSPRARRMP